LQKERIMAAQNLSDPAQLDGVTVHDSDGGKIGKVSDVYLDQDTSRPEWAAVKTGMFGGHVSLVPLANANFDGEALKVPYSKDQVKNAPHQDPAQELSPAQEAEIFEHYGVAYGGETVTAQPGGQGKQESAQTGGKGKQESGQRRDRAGEPGVEGKDTSGPTTDKAMTRSEEQLHVGTEQTHGGTARLRKYVVSEDVTKTVPVRHEEVRIEREPITDANRGDAMAGSELSEEEHEVNLRAEKAVVTKEAVPVERVKLGTETVTEEHTVNETVSKEQIEMDDESGTQKKQR
jgi:uncharacterized protein (TIGR02271 family)